MRENVWCLFKLEVCTCFLTSYSKTESVLFWGVVVEQQNTQGIVVSFVLLALLSSKRKKLSCLRCTLGIV